jgi:hypothetical protein
MTKTEVDKLEAIVKRTTDPEEPTGVTTDEILWMVEQIRNGQQTVRALQERVYFLGMALKVTL